MEIYIFGIEKHPMFKRTMGCQALGRVVPFFYALPLSIKFQYIKGRPYFFRSHIENCSFVVSTNLEIKG